MAYEIELCYLERKLTELIQLQNDYASSGDRFLLADIRELQGEIEVMEHSLYSFV